MSEYQGHPSKAAWNVALWIANDEPLYREACRLKRKYRSNAKAANGFMIHLLTAFSLPQYYTPDGFKWTKTNVRRAIAGLEIDKLT